MIFHFILSELHLLSPTGPQGHLEVFRQSVVISSSPTNPLGRVGLAYFSGPVALGVAHFEILECSALFSSQPHTLLLPFSLHLISHPPGGISAPAHLSSFWEPLASLFGQLALVRRCAGRPPGPCRGRWEVRWPLPKAGSAKCACRVCFKVSFGHLIPGRRDTSKCPPHSPIQVCSLWWKVG